MQGLLPEQSEEAARLGNAPYAEHHGCINTSTPLIPRRRGTLLIMHNQYLQLRFSLVTRILKFSQSFREVF